MCLYFLKDALSFSMLFLWIVTKKDGKLLKIFVLV
jgi:hypothetical protein